MCWATSIHVYRIAQVYAPFNFAHYRACVCEDLDRVIAATDAALNGASQDVQRVVTSVLESSLHQRSLLERAGKRGAETTWHVWTQGEIESERARWKSDWREAERLAERALPSSDA